VCDGAEVCQAIVEAVVVDMVADHAIRDVNDEMVHVFVLSLFFPFVKERTA